VIIEAMAAGAPLIVSDHAPNIEVVGDTAATFALAGGAEALAVTIGELLDDPARREALGATAAERARERFSWSRCADRYLTIAETLLKS